MSCQKVLFDRTRERKQRGRGRREALPGYDITQKMSWPNLLCRSQNTTFPPERKRSSTAQSNQMRERVNPTTFPSESRPPCHADRPPIPPSDDDIVNRFVQRGDDDDDIALPKQTDVHIVPGGISSPSDTVLWYSPEMCGAVLRSAPAVRIIVPWLDSQI